MPRQIPSVDDAVTFDRTDAREVVASNLRQYLMRIRRLRYLQPADQEDVSHDTLIRLLERNASEEWAVDFFQDEENWSKPLEASRSAVRRKIQKRSKELPFNDEICKSHSTDSDSPSVRVSDEALSKIAESVSLTHLETELLRCLALGLDDAESISRELRIHKDRVYRIKSTLKSKLKPIAREIERILLQE